MSGPSTNEPWQNSYNVVLIDCYSVVKNGFTYFWAHKSTPSQRFFWKIDYEGVFVLPVDKAENYFEFVWKWNVLFPCSILIFQAMYAMLALIENWIIMFADTVVPDIIWILSGFISRRAWHYMNYVRQSYSRLSAASQHCKSWSWPCL